MVGHPKSCNTWLAYLLAILPRNGDPEGFIMVANQEHALAAACERGSFEAMRAEARA